MAAWFGVHRSTVTRSIVGVRPLLAERGCRVHDGVRLRLWPTWSEYLGQHPRTLMDATEVRGPPLGRGAAAPHRRWVTGPPDNRARGS
ncbi:hypothetical protein AB0J51_16200 [Micromonospora echinofusca]|uniref:hypothetical protein n=1 Tax=Micromonospora echinofusca TaxID=47858 RepID=UPI00341E3F57